MRAEVPEPSIRGSFITTGKAWIIKTYGEDLWRRALATLGAEQQALFGFEIVGTSWYSIEEWTKALDAVRAEVLIKTGENGTTFDRRLMHESIGVTMDKIFRVAFKLLSPTTVVAKVTPYFQKVYSHGSYSVVENQVGRCRLRLSDTPLKMEQEVRRAFPIASRWMLDVAGQDVKKLDLTSTVRGGVMSSDIVMEYAPKGKR
jgi:hypothetical protein